MDTHGRRMEDFILSVDLLPLRIRSLAATGLPIAAATVADAAQALEGRAATLGRLAYVLAEHGWDLAIVGDFTLEARRRCRRVDVERLLSGSPELAALATIYLEDAGDATQGPTQRELFWADEESRLVTA